MAEVEDQFNIRQDSKSPEKDNSLGITVCSIGDLCAARQIIEPIQAGLLGDWVNTAQQQIDVVGLPASQAASKFSAHKARHCCRSQVRLITHCIEGDIGLDVFGKLDGVACLARECYQRVLVQGSGFVVARF